MKNQITAQQLQISGLVQGVGFRPFLFSLADQYRLSGEVSNTADGVLTIVEGLSADIQLFIRDIREKQPVLADVTRIVSKPLTVKGFTDFNIVPTLSSDKADTLISPDVTVCDECLSEMRNPDDRRFEYPFINCTNCGPRYTIIKDIPYDRPKTSMKSFLMCDDCQKEYDNPIDRRFHAQPNACPVCGPKVFMTDSRGCRIDLSPENAIQKAVDLLREGKIVAVKGVGGFHLAADAENHETVCLLRKRKKRPHKPFALMAQSGSTLLSHVHLSQKEKSLLYSFQRPIVLLKKKDDDCGLSSSIAPFNRYFGIMLPYTPLHYLLLEKGPDILVMTSGNRSGEPLAIENQNALDNFSHIADFFLFHDRDIYFRADDSIAAVQAGKPRFIRRSRGYAPLPLDLDIKPYTTISSGQPLSGTDENLPSVKRELPSILGFGAEMKSTICITKGSKYFLSQHIGEIRNQKVFDFYTCSIDHLKKILNVEPQVIAHDLHPDYMSTRYAETLAPKTEKRYAIQHHHAHAVSCMAENDLNEKVIAITLDGTGFGTDGHIWGGEILLCTRKRFKRKARLAYLPMPGGDKAVSEPWRMAASILFKAFGKAFTDLDIQYIKEMDLKNLQFIIKMIQKNLNSPLTSSAGRLFDAVSSLLCIRHFISHESQAAMELEAAAASALSDQKPYDFSIIEKNRKDTTILTPETYYEIDFVPCIREIVGDLSGSTINRDTDIISSRFHQTVITAYAKAAKMISMETGILKTVLSGGVFNNHLILSGMKKALEKNRLKVFTHTRVPTGDGGICLGQAASAQALLE